MILIIKILFNFIYYALLIRVLLSWFPYRSANNFTAFIFNVTEPMLNPIRSVVPQNQSRLDFSPLILFIILNFLKTQLLLIG